VRRLGTSKSNTCTESLGVDAAGISGKVSIITQGDLSSCLVLLSLKGDGMRCQKSADGIVGPLDRTEGQNVNIKKGNLNSSNGGGADDPDEKLESPMQVMDGIYELNWWSTKRYGNERTDLFFKAASNDGSSGRVRKYESGLSPSCEE